jgi:hypothetical protein
VALGQESGWFHHSEKSYTRAAAISNQQSPGGLLFVVLCSQPVSVVTLSIEF